MRVSTIHLQFTEIRDPDARIGQQQGPALGLADLLPEGNGVDQNGKTGVKEKDQTLQAGRNILQAYKIKITAEIITQQSQHDDIQPFPTAHPHIAFFTAAPISSK